MSAGLPSIRGRLSRVLVIASVAWALAVSAVVWMAVHHEVDEIMDQALRESAEVLYGTLQVQRGALGAEDGEPLPAPPHEEHLVWQLLGADGRVLARSHQAPREAMGVPGQTGLWSREPHWRVCGMVFPAQARTLLVAQRMPERHEARIEASAVTAGLAALVGLACAAWLSVRARRELLPLTEMSDTVAHYDPHSGAESLAAAQRAELVPMREAIVALATRLARHAANERAITAHAAHALRTPLAGLVVQLATAQKNSPPEVQPSLRQARAAADRLRRVVGALITLFRSGGEVNRVPVELPALLTHLPAAGVAVTAEGLPSLEADADLLAAALANLLDNAARHGARAVRVRAEQTADGHQWLTMHDDGQGCLEAQRQALAAALATQSYEAGGVGMGLMLADLVARAHGGSLTLAAAERGFLVRLDLGPPEARPT